ncbi:MAG: SMP-30/gluconolactonase/LRE family protein [Chitinophagaceae bacterium]|nr:SMP-30/gluconolactonase/LRE family protein [Chitinophagaceae bacterium]MBN8667551.1 SMP-30/gluconolactonase/LRE family protein [Chitinophagales bacterium]
MKKRTLFFLGVLCAFGYLSCSKNVEPKEEELLSTQEDSRGGHHNGSSCDPDDLIEPGAQVVTLGEGYSFTEGPAVDKWGNVFFTDQPNDKIYKWNAQTGQITNFLTGTGRSNGMAFDKHGNLIACADMHGEIWKIRPNGTHTVLVNNYRGKLLNGPNDVWINPKTGGMYITDPIFPRGYWDENDPRKQGWPPTHSEQAATGKGGHVYYLAPGSHSLVRVTNEAMGWDADSWPNGVVGTPDGKKLYVNKWEGDNMGGTWVFDIKPNGRLANMRKFIEMGGDGMSMDEKGNIYISNGLGVNIFSPQGVQITTISTGSGATNNVFAGRNEKTLFITGPVDKVSSIKMKVKGVEKF